jgi:hypothetical protein
MTMATRKKKKTVTHRDPVDEHAATELVMFIENTSDLSPDGPQGQGRSVLLNALRKWKKGTYDPALAVRLFEYLAEAGAKRYQKEFGSDAPIFSPATRHEAARQLEASFRSSAEGGEYDHVDTRIGVREEKPIPYDDDTPEQKDERDKRKIFIHDEEALKLMQGWTGGQDDPLYAISSTGGWNYAWVFTDAIANIDRDLSGVRKLGRNKFQLGKGTFTKKEIGELEYIRDALQMALDDPESVMVDEESRRSESQRRWGPCRFCGATGWTTSAWRWGNPLYHHDRPQGGQCLQALKAEKAGSVREASMDEVKTREVNQQRVARVGSAARRLRSAPAAR